MLIKTIEKVQELFNFDTEKGLIDRVVSTLDVDFQEVYEPIAKAADYALLAKHGTRKLFDGMQFESTEEPKRLLLFVKEELITNSYRFKTLLESTTQEYNPLYNYNMEYTEHRTDDGIDTSEDRYTKNVNDEGSDNTDNTSNFGETTTTEKTAPFDSESFSNASQSLKGSETDTYTNARTYEEERTDEGTSSGTKTMNNTRDISSTKKGYVNVNPQKQLEEQRRLANINIAEILASLVANLISWGVWEC